MPDTAAVKTATNPSNQTKKTLTLAEFCQYMRAIQSELITSCTRSNLGI